MRMGPRRDGGAGEQVAPDYGRVPGGAAGLPGWGEVNWVCKPGALTGV